MNENPLQVTPVQQLKMIKFTWIAMFTGIIVFSAIAFAVNKINGPFIEKPDFEKVFLGFAGLFAVICLALAPFLFRKSLKKNLTGKSILIEKLTSYRAALVLYLALCETPAILSVIGFLFTGNYYFGIIIATSLLGFLVKFPEKFKISEALQLDASERMQIE